MKIDALLTDDAVLAELGRRLARARLARNLSQPALAAEAGVSERTLVRVEAGQSASLVNLVRILRPLGLLEGLDALIPADTVNPYTELSQRGLVRRRASRTVKGGAPAAPEGRWVWGDEREDAG